MKFSLQGEVFNVKTDIVADVSAARVAPDAQVGEAETDLVAVLLRMAHHILIDVPATIHLRHEADFLGHILARAWKQKKYRPDSISDRSNSRRRRCTNHMAMPCRCPMPALRSRFRQCARTTSLADKRRSLPTAPVMRRERQSFLTFLMHNKAVKIR